jgi:CDGSH-type Zn-finger protein
MSIRSEACRMKILLTKTALHAAVLVKCRHERSTTKGCGFSSNTPFKNARQLLAALVLWQQPKS